MTKIMNATVTPIADILMLNGRFILNNQGIDTIQIVAKYETFKNMAERMGLTMQPIPKGHKRYEKLNDEVEDDSKARRNKSSFKPMVELIKLPKVNSMDKYSQIVITRNTPLLFDVATHHKKAKDTYCLVTFAGLHQPTKKISSEAMGIISKFLKRKAFKPYSLDIATDTQDNRPIDKAHKQGFKADLMPYSEHGVNLEKTSYYINRLEHERMSKVNYYNKYNKQLEKQKKGVITKDLKAWKRLEVTFTFDVTKKNSLNFTDYINSMDFLDDIGDIEKLTKLAGIKSYHSDYLTYQINSLLDNRFMNNHESKRQFNSVESLDRFKRSDFRRYILPI
jgi:hypothetical protein